MTKKTVLITSLALLLLVAALYLALNFWVKSMVDERMDEFVAGGYYQSLDYDNVWVQPNGEITMKDLHVVDIDENEYIFQDITISEFDYFNTFPHHLKLTAEGMQFPGGHHNLAICRRVAGILTWKRSSRMTCCQFS